MKITRGSKKIMVKLIEERGKHINKKAMSAR